MPTSSRGSSDDANMRRRGAKFFHDQHIFVRRSRHKTDIVFRYSQLLLSTITMIIIAVIIIIIIIIIILNTINYYYYY